MNRKSILYIFLTLYLLLSLTGCSEKPVTKQIFAMDTYMELTAYGDNAEVALTDIIHTINGYAPAATITEVSPANDATVEELSHFIFTFSYFASHSDYPSQMPVLSVEGSEWTHALEKTLTKSDGSTIKMDQAALKTTEPVLGNGVYILEIPTGYFTDGNGKEIEGITLKYTVKNDSGLEASIEDIVTEDSGHWTVYSITGIKVLESTEATSLSTLKPGIYIINGKKVSIR